MFALCGVQVLRLRAQGLGALGFSQEGDLELPRALSGLLARQGSVRACTWTWLGSSFPELENLLVCGCGGGDPGPGPCARGQECASL